MSVRIQTLVCSVALLALATPVAAVDETAASAGAENSARATSGAGGVAGESWGSGYPHPAASVVAAARAHLAARAGELGLPPEALAAAVVREVDRTSRRWAIVRFGQDSGGYPVFRAALNVLLGPDLRPLAVTGALSPPARPAGQGGASARFRIDEKEAVAAALRALGLADRVRESRFWRVVAERPPYRTYSLPGVGEVEHPAVSIRLRRVLFAHPEKLKAAYYIEVTAPAAGTHRRPQRGSTTAIATALVLSAAPPPSSSTSPGTGPRVLFRHDLRTHAGEAGPAFTYRVWADAGEGSDRFPQDGPAGDAGAPHPTAQPDDAGPPPPPAERNRVTLRCLRENGDPWLPAGARETRGNHADVYADLRAPDGFSPGDRRAPLSARLTFDHPYEPGLPPENRGQRDAALTHLFYVVNFLHDWFYERGFDEAAGNAQGDNFGRGGLGGDRLLAEAHDPGGRNNATAVTPADGASPRLELSLFDHPGERVLSVVEPAEMAGDHPSGAADFGPSDYDVSALAALPDDGTANPRRACAPFRNAAAVAGKIVLAESGGCAVWQKALHAANAGAAGLVVINDTGGAPPLTAGGDPGAGAVEIPVRSIGLPAGKRLLATLARGGEVRFALRREPRPGRDSALDSLLVAHEWGHYLSARLIGDANGLDNAQGRALAEGWSDFLALWLTVEEPDLEIPSNAAFSGAYAVGGHATGDYYFGLRRYPYSTGRHLCPLTFGHLAPGAAPPAAAPANPARAATPNAGRHNAGEIWCTALWEAYAALLNDRRLTFDQARDRMSRYLVASLKMTPLSPTFTEARDALLAVVAAGDSADFERFATAFARRGLGAGAVAPARRSETFAGVVESFTPAGSGVGPSTLTLGDERYSCDADGVCDRGESGTLTVHFAGPPGRGETLRARLEVDPASAFEGWGGGVEVEVPPPLHADGRQTVAVPVVCAAPLGVGVATVTVRAFDAAGAPAGAEVRFEVAINRDQAPGSSSIDRVESGAQGWTSAPPGAGWSIVPAPGGGQEWSAPGRPETHDHTLTSPPLEIIAGEPFVLAFTHRYDFEEGGFDGGVIEVSTDGGRTWSDAGEVADPGGAPTYPGTLLALGSNPLAGRPAYVGRSSGYPATVEERVDIGRRFARGTLHVRFRAAGDASGSGAGWQVDNITCSGCVPPFATTVPETESCPPPEPPVLRLPEVILAGADTAVALEGLDLSRFGSAGSAVRMTLTATRGTLVPGNDLAGELTGVGTGSLTVRSTLAALREFLGRRGSLTYFPGPAAEGINAANLVVSIGGEDAGGNGVNLVRTIPLRLFPNGFEAWQNAHFSAGEIRAEPGPASRHRPGDDPDGDGLTNLAEYALGGTPVAPDPERAGPRLLRASPGGAALRTRLNASDSRLRVRLESAPQPGPEAAWQHVPSAADAVANPPRPAPVDITLPVLPDGDRARFFRLRFQLVP